MRRKRKRLTKKQKIAFGVGIVTTAAMAGGLGVGHYHKRKRQKKQNISDFRDLSQKGLKQQKQIYRQREYDKGAAQREQKRLRKNALEKAQRDARTQRRQTELDRAYARSKLRPKKRVKVQKKKLWQTNAENSFEN